MSENERLNALAEHYYAVAKDLQHNGSEQIRVADMLSAFADAISEQAMKAADLERADVAADVAGN